MMRTEKEIIDRIDELGKDLIDEATGENRELDLMVIESMLQALRWSIGLIEWPIPNKEEGK